MQNRTYDCDEHFVAHVLDRNVIDEAGNNRPGSLLGNVDLLNVETISVWVLHDYLTSESQASTEQ